MINLTNNYLPEQIKHIHLMGVCGTAMGSLAGMLKENGYRITGSDQAVYPPMSTFLANLGISVQVGYGPENLQPRPDLVIVGNVITKINPEAQELMRLGLPFLSLPQALAQLFLKDKMSLVITGTHGKTTTSSVLTSILDQAGLSPSFMIGGILRGYERNYQIGSGPYFVFEGDEYDTAFFDKLSKFLHYLPELVVINNIEFDHADIFANLDEIKLSFQRLLRLVPSEGVILINGDDANARDVAEQAPAPVIEVGFSENCGHRIREAWQAEGHAGFELLGEKFEIAMNGEHNIRNAAMAASSAHFYGIPLASIREALLKFTGIKRRQEIVGIINGITLIDDFGHHPTAIRETLAGLHAHYPHARLWALFEPRSNTSRRAVFQEVLPAAFEKAAGVIVGAVNRATQLHNEERLNPERLVADIAATGKPAFYESNTDQIITRVKSLAKPGDVIVIFSNGSFDQLKDKLIMKLKS